MKNKKEKDMLQKLQEFCKENNLKICAYKVLEWHNCNEVITLETTLSITGAE